MLKICLKTLNERFFVAASCCLNSFLGLFTGKLLIVGFVITISCHSMEQEKGEFDGLQPVAFKRRAKEVLQERNTLSLEVKELQEQLAQALQQQAAQPIMQAAGVAQNQPEIAHFQQQLLQQQQLVQQEQLLQQEQLVQLQQARRQLQEQLLEAQQLAQGGVQNQLQIVDLQQQLVLQQQTAQLQQLTYQEQLEQQQQTAQRLQEQLFALQSMQVEATEATILATRQDLDTALNSGGALDSPIKKINSRVKAQDTPGRGKLRREITELQLTGKKTEDLAMVLQLFKRYADRKTATSDSTALARRSGDSQIVTVDLSDILTALNYAVAGVFGSQMQSLCKQFYVPASSLQQPKSLTIDLNVIGDKYINKISQAIQTEGKLCKAIRMILKKADLTEDINAMSLNLKDKFDIAAREFRRSKKANDVYEVHNEFVKELYANTYCVFFQYIADHAEGSSDTMAMQLFQQDLSEIFGQAPIRIDISTTRYTIGGGTQNLNTGNALNYLPVLLPGQPVAKSVLYLLSFLSCQPSAYTQSQETRNTASASHSITSAPVVQSSIGNEGGSSSEGNGNCSSSSSLPTDTRTEVINDIQNGTSTLNPILESVVNGAV